MRSLFRFISAVFGVIWRCVVFLRRLITTLIFVVLLFLIVSLFAGRQAPVLEDGVLVVDPAGRLTEQLEGTPLQLALQQASEEPPAETLLQDLIKAIDLGAEDDRVEALLLDTAALEPSSLSKLRQLGAAVARFRDSGKPVYAHGFFYDQSQYYLASQADKIALDPYGAVLIEGFGMFPRYFAEALDKLNVTVNVFRVGEYKSAVEPFLRSDMSDEAKRSNRVWLDQLWNSWRVDVESRRELSLGALQRYADMYPELLEKVQGNAAKAADNAGLVDWVETRHAFEERLARQYGKDEDNRFKQINYRALVAEDQRKQTLAAAKQELGGGESENSAANTPIQSEMANDPLAEPATADSGMVEAASAESQQSTTADLFAEEGRAADALDAAKQLQERPKPKGSKVGLIYAVGAIMGGEQPSGTIGGDTLSALIDQAGKDKDIAALLLRVDSPGGSVFASEQVRLAVERFQARGKPVVASMSTYAASGGYWISMNANEIWASPITLTGSIGIFGLVPNFSKLANGLGVYADGVGTTNYASAQNLDQPMSAGVRKAIQQSVNFGYNEFIQKVAAARELSVQQVDAIARGRVWTGLDALRIGLVDQLGTQKEAELAVKRLAGLSADAAVELVEAESAAWSRMMARFLGGALQTSVGAGAIRSVLMATQPESLFSLLSSSSNSLILNALSEVSEVLPQWLGSDRQGLYAHCFCEL